MTKAKETAFHRGKDARRAGVERGACPYRNRESKAAWLAGWDEQGRLAAAPQVSDEQRDAVRAGLSALRDHLRRR